jgi:hypothetical protein
MTTERERHLLTRCLRLEAEIAKLKGYMVAPPSILRPPGVSMSPLIPPVQGIHRTTPGDIAQMRMLRRRGCTYSEIGRVAGFSQQTAKYYTADVLMEHEMGAT